MKLSSRSVGGWAAGGDDGELLVRLHRRLRSDGDSRRIAFVPDLVCRTQALQFRPRRLLDRAAALIELVGLPAVVAGVALGAVSLPLLALFLSVSVVLSALVSFSAFAVEELNFPRRAGAREVARFLLVAVAENFGARQVAAVSRLH